MFSAYRLNFVLLRVCLNQSYGFRAVAMSLFEERPSIDVLPYV